MPVKGSTLFQNQYIQTTGVNSGAPLIISGNALSFGLYNYEASSSAATTITTTIQTLGSAAPTAGTYLVYFSCNVTASSAGGNILKLQLYIGGAAQADTLRECTPLSSAALSVFQYMSPSTNKLAIVNGSQAIALEASTSAGTVTLTGYNFNVVRIA